MGVLNLDQDYSTQRGGTFVPAEHSQEQKNSSEPLGKTVLEAEIGGLRNLEVTLTRNMQDVYSAIKNIVLLQKETAKQS